MRRIQNTNISFRATKDLKNRLTEFCEKNDVHNSFVIRQALVAYLKGQMEKLPHLMSDEMTVIHVG